MGLTRTELAALRKEKTLSSSYKDRAWGKCLLAIPRHLLKVSILMIVSSFVAILVLVNSDSSLEDFIKRSQAETDLSKEGLHPFYAHLQASVIRDSSVRHEIRERWKQKPTKAHSFIETRLESVTQ